MSFEYGESELNVGQELSGGEQIDGGYNGYRFANVVGDRGSRD